MRSIHRENCSNLLLLLFVFGVAPGANAQSYVNTAHVVDSAGGVSQSSSYSNISAIGQPYGFDQSRGSSYVNKGGFLQRAFSSGGNVIVDSDGDGLSDSAEEDIHKTDPNNADTDGDGYSDWYEIAHVWGD